MNMIKLYEVPVPSTAFIREAYLVDCYELRYRYKLDGKLIDGGIRFKWVSALRQRAERCCKSWHIKAYDTLVEIENSEWATEIREDTVPWHRDFKGHHHYMIYLDSMGCYEFIADSWEVIEEVYDQNSC